jgi:hypothetical protein
MTGISFVFPPGERQNTPCQAYFISRQEKTALPMALIIFAQTQTTPYLEIKISH